MKKEKSCGCIIINNNKVLLVFEKNRNFWGFPKGHVENNETEFETAMRECKEEVGLDVILFKDCRYETEYKIGNKIDKSVILYLATVKDNFVTMQESEIEKYKWCSFEETNKLLIYDNLKEVFSKALDDYFRKE